MPDAPAPPAATGRRAAVGFIFGTLVLIVLGFGIIIPVLPKLVTEFRGGDVSAGSGTFGLLVGLFALMQFVSAPVLGALSDRFGRRRIVLIALTGTSLDYLLMAWAPSLGWLFLARLIAGLTAGSLAAANAYIADVSPPEKRAQNFGLLGAAFGIGFVLGPALGGVLGEIHLRLPFLVAAGLTGINVLYGLFVLPESLRPENRRPFSWRRANPIASIAALRDFPRVVPLAWVHFLSMFAQTMLHSVWVLYTAHRFGWGPREVGLSLTFVGLTAGAVQGGLIRRIVPRLGEERSVLVGLGFAVVSFVGYGISTEGWMVYAFILLGALGGIAGPASQSIVAHAVTPDRQGAVQGAFGGLGSVAGIAAPPLSAWLFGRAIAPDAWLPLAGISFFVAAVFFVAALVVCRSAFARLHVPSAST